MKTSHENTEGFDFKKLFTTLSVSRSRRAFIKGAAAGAALAVACPHALPALQCAVEQKIAREQPWSEVFDALFEALRHDLMTGRLWVKNGPSFPAPAAAT